MQNQEPKQYATSHYLHYPEGDFPPYLAYGFRPIFLLLAPYIIFLILMWSLIYSGVISIPFMNNMLSWHIYEFLYGVGTAGILAFLFTGLPELYPGVVPMVGKRLRNIVLLWVAGRISFWFVDLIGVYPVAIINLSLIVWVILWAFKPVVLDPLQRHASIAYTLVGIFFIQIWFFASMANLVETSNLEILQIALGAFMVLELLALRRVNMEAMNEILEDDGIDDVFVAKAPRYNLAVFTVILFTAVEFFFPNNSTLGWIGLAAAAAILGILNDFILEDTNILLKPFTLFMMSILVLMALGYGFMGYDYLNEDIYALNHFRHFLTTGVFGLSFLMVMFIISTVHTGRHLKANIWIWISVILILVATFMRTMIPFFQEYTEFLYAASAVVWALPFAIYIKLYFRHLLSPRADGIPG